MVVRTVFICSFEILFLLQGSVLEIKGVTRYVHWGKKAQAQIDHQDTFAKS